MSTLFKSSIQSSKEHTVQVIVTTQRKGYTANGIPRHTIQVWMDRCPARSEILNTESAGKLWSPIIKGYRKNKQDQYIITSYNIEQDIEHFLAAFEMAIQS